MDGFQSLATAGTELRATCTKPDVDRHVFHFLTHMWITGNDNFLEVEGIIWFSEPGEKTSMLKGD